MRKTLLAFATAALLGLPAAAETYNIDASHSGVNFTIRHLVAKTPGKFDKFSGAIDLNSANMEASSVNFEIETSSINTGNTDRDNHLRSADFFDAEKCPKITFKSSKIAKTGENQFNVTGTLDMRCTAKEITLPVTFLGAMPGMRGNKLAGFESNVTINRKDFGISWNRALDQGGFVLSDEVWVTINLETGTPPPPPPAK